MDLPKTLKQNAHIFCVLARVRDLKTLRSIVKDKKPNFFKSLANICRNFLVGNLGLTKSQTRKLKKHAENLRVLYETRDSKKIRSVLLRHGGEIIFIICQILEPWLLRAISSA